MNNLKTKLKSFKLAGMINSLDERISYANQNQLSYTEFLQMLCDDEYQNRQENSYKKRAAKAKLPIFKRLEDFDFSFQTSIDKKLVNDIATCQFIEKKNNVLLIGNPGTGKTHLSISFAIKALNKGYNVLFTDCSDMLYRIHISKADNSYRKVINQYLKADLLIIDELGFKKLPTYSANDFFDIISKRYESGSTIITTNKDFNQWSDIFDDNEIAKAVIDRLVHHSYIFNIKGKSYRSKNIKFNQTNIMEENMDNR